MRDLVFSFLSGVLGTDGARALRKAVGRQPALEPLLVPRAALAWLRHRSRHEGPVPGVANSYLRLEKSGGVNTGTVSIGGGQYAFASADDLHVAAAVAVAVGVELGGPRIRDLTLFRLGKSIDDLVDAQESLRNSLRKVELPGQTHRPTAQVPPAAPQAPQKQPRTAKPKLPKKPRVPALKVEKSDAARACAACGGTQFRGERFTGCICFREFSKNVVTTAYGDGYVLEFKPGADEASMHAIVDALRGPS